MEWSKTETQHIIWNSQPMCRGRSKFVSDPGLNYKIPTSLCISRPNSSSHLLLLLLFFPPLFPFHSASYICSTFGCTRRSTLCLFHLLLLSLHHSENGIHVLPRSREDTSIPQRGGCQRAKEREARCCFLLNFSFLSMKYTLLRAENTDHMGTL